MHFQAYPDIEVMVTFEVFSQYRGAFVDQVFDSGLSNSELSKITKETFEKSGAEAFSDLVQDGAITSALVAGANQASYVLDGRSVDRRSLRSLLEALGLGVATAVAVEALINAV